MLTDLSGHAGWEASSIGCNVKYLSARRPWNARAGVGSLAPAPRTSLVSLQKPARSSRIDVFNLYFPPTFGPHPTPGQLSNLEVELHLSVNDEAGEVAVMRHRAGGSTSWDSYRGHM